MKKAITTLLLIPFYLFLSASSAHGQTPLGLSLTPSLFEAYIAPGKSVSQVYTLTNLGQGPVTLVARIIPFVPSDESGRPILKPNQRPEWLKYFSLKNSHEQLNEPFALGAGDHHQLILSLDIPYQTAPGDLYATLLITTSLPEDGSQTQNNTAIGTAIGSNLLITVSPSSHPPALVKIENFAPDSADYFFRYSDYYFVDNLFPIHFSATAVNVGKYFTKTSGRLTVSHQEKPVAIQNLIPLNLLAYSSRSLEGSPSAELVFKPRLTDIGSFRIGLDIRSENSTSRSEITLVLIPVRLLTGLIICLILFSVVIKISHKNTHKPER